MIAILSTCVALVLVDPGVLSKQSGAHLLEALLLLGSDFFDTFGLSLMHRFGINLTVDNIHDRDDDRSALGVLK